MLGDVLEGLDIKRRAVERTGIASFVSELEQVVLSSFEYGEISKIPCLVGTDRKKGSAVSSNYCVTHLYFGSDRIFLYSYLFSVIGRHAREEVAEVCYRVSSARARAQKARP